MIVLSKIQQFDNDNIPVQVSRGTVTEDYLEENPWGIDLTEVKNEEILGKDWIHCMIAKPKRYSLDWLEGYFAIGTTKEIDDTVGLVENAWVTKPQSLTERTKEIIEVTRPKDSLDVANLIFDTLAELGPDVFDGVFISEGKLYLTVDEKEFTVTVRKSHSKIEKESNNDV